MFLLSKLVRDNGFAVVVTGEGADEVLGGYDIFREAQARLFWGRDPDSPVRARAVELLYPWMQRRAPGFATTFFGRNLDPADPAVSHRPRWESTGALRSLLAPPLRQPVGADVVARMPPESRDWDPLSRAQWLELTTLLPGYLLASQGDRMLMANSVEGRFPFLDRDVVEFANALPARHKLQGLTEKYLLRRAFRDLLPEEILTRPKQPYRAPDAASFFAAEPGPEWLNDVISPAAIRAAGLFDEAAVTSLFAKCRQRGGRGLGNTDNMRVLAVLSAQLTHHQFIVGAGAGGTESLPPVNMAADLAANDGSMA
jgi:asparagine synthase (glutamine-hydrolysing)